VKNVVNSCISKIAFGAAGCKGIYIGGILEGYEEAGCGGVSEALKNGGNWLKWVLVAGRRLTE
jgi:hypothetical protein